MSALPSSLHTSTGASDPATDPSMEEILASIRRIIADDHGTPINPRPSRMASVGEAVGAPQRADLPRPRPAPEPAVVQPIHRAPAEAVTSLETASLRGSMPDSPVIEHISRLETAPARPRPVLRQTYDEAFRPQPEAPAPEPAAEAPAIQAPAIQTPAPVEAAPQVESLLSPLARASVTSAFEALTVSMAAQNSSLVEDAVRDMLRPMLKQWLDDNLPTIVERLVRAEIERVARGGRP